MVNSPPLGIASQAVADQVQHGLPQLFGVGVDGRQRRIEMGAQLHLRPFELAAQERQFLVEKRVQGHRLPLQFRQPGELQIILQHALDALDLLAHFIDERAPFFG